MRAIAAEAKVATGLLYRYFPSKDAVVLEFYAEHTARVEQRLKKEAEREAPRSPAERFRMALVVELDSLSKNQSRLLLALMQLALTPSSPAWLFSKETEAFRAHARGSMRWVLEHAHISGDALETLTYALWALRMALLYFALNDVSPQQKRSRALIEEVSHLLVGLPLLAPLASPWFVKIGRMLRDAGVPFDAD
jgi:AcrR family transcriptional regulator